MASGYMKVGKKSSRSEAMKENKNAEHKFKLRKNGRESNSQEDSQW